MIAARRWAVFGGLPTITALGEHPWNQVSPGCGSVVRSPRKNRQHAARPEFYRATVQANDVGKFAPPASADRRHGISVFGTPWIPLRISPSSGWLWRCGGRSALNSAAEHSRRGGYGIG